MTFLSVYSAVTLEFYGFASCSQEWGVNVSVVQPEDGQQQHKSVEQGPEAAVQ